MPSERHCEREPGFQIRALIKRVVRLSTASIQPVLAMFFFIASPLSPALGQLNPTMPSQLQGVGVDEKLGERIRLDIPFLTHDSTLITLGEIAALGKPILLNPLYYECPVLCNLVIEGVEKSVYNLDWSPGREYIIVSFSIDEGEGPSQAAVARERILAGLPHPSAATGWYFLTDPKDPVEKGISGSDSEPLSSSRRLAEAVGFQYKPEPITGEIIHPAAIMFLATEQDEFGAQQGVPASYQDELGAQQGVPASSQQGIPASQRDARAQHSHSLTVSRYLYGFTFNPFDMKNALYEAADGKVGSVVEQVLLYCYTYDPTQRAYVPLAKNIMKLGGLATVLILGIFFTALWMREKRRNSSETLLFHE